MAGKGIVLLETATFWPESLFVGVDSDPEQLRKAWANADAIGAGSRCSLVLGDARSLPLADGSADVGLRDLPYSLQHGDIASKPQH
mmetsp:Transcript_35700/g.71994  ORF Transcript_35700/g.71994 Transcript_35700/m.71994 type:complete len:86 (-) Transcript_35700:13-270(-)